MKKQTQVQPVPTAHLCINKSRLKTYQTDTLPTYYLENGSEFSIELFNPINKVVLAKIELNGVSLSQGGLIIKPAQRIFLERYLDVASKFKFETYNVSNTEESIKAIVQNGDFVVKFYYEATPPPPVQPRYPYGYPNISYIPPVVTITPNGAGSIYPTHDMGMNMTPLNNFYSQTNGIVTSSVSSGNEATLDFLGNSSYTTSTSKSGTYTTSNTSTGALNQSGLKSALRSKSLSKKIETGRVEEGSASNQKFKYTSKTFMMYPFHVIEYKMLPISQKINTENDLKVKVYCTACGAKLKPEFKFCPSCGKSC